MLAAVLLLLTAFAVQCSSCRGVAPQATFRLLNFILQDELKTVLHWLKQLAALALGCAFGAAGVTGGYAFLAYLTLSTFLTVTFYRNILGVDEDEFGGATELMMEGFAPAVAVFLLLWILGFTALAAPR